MDGSLARGLAREVCALRTESLIRQLCWSVCSPAQTTAGMKKEEDHMQIQNKKALRIKEIKTRMMMGEKEVLSCQTCVSSNLQEQWRGHELWETELRNCMAEIADGIT